MLDLFKEILLSEEPEFRYNIDDNYSYDVKVLEKNSFSLLKYELDTIGSFDSNIDIINKNIRNSYSCTKNIGLYNIKISKENLNELKEVLPIHIREFDFTYECQWNDRGNYKKWTLHKYMKGSKFSKHVDGQSSPHHYGTLLILPPKDLYNFEGGNLIIYDENKKFIINHDQTKWKLVFFPINVLHEVEEITSGTRYVLKSKLFLPNIFRNIMSCKEYNQNVDVSLNKENIEFKKLLESEIKNLELDLIKKKNLFEIINNPSCNKLHEVVEKVILNESETAFIILDKFYREKDPKYLIGQDGIIFNQLIKSFPKCSIRLVNLFTTRNCGDGSNYEPNEYLSLNLQSMEEHILPEYNLDLDISTCYRDIFYSNKDKNVFYAYMTKEYTPGEFIHMRSEFNDTSYDKLQDQCVTVIYLIKNKI